ncbi:MAG: hypothetical protein SFU98_06305 [Leptospiraceae bacterium]|nr:hypothetical protein [Leptospiraceae bacterium]
MLDKRIFKILFISFIILLKVNCLIISDPYFPPTKIKVRKDINNEIYFSVGFFDNWSSVKVEDDSGDVVWFIIFDNMSYTKEIRYGEVVKGAIVKELPHKLIKGKRYYVNDVRKEVLFIE